MKWLATVSVAVAVLILLVAGLAWNSLPPPHEERDNCLATGGFWRSGWCEGGRAP